MNVLKEKLENFNNINSKFTVKNSNYKFKLKVDGFKLIIVMEFNKLSVSLKNKNYYICINNISNIEEYKNTIEKIKENVNKYTKFPDDISYLFNYTTSA